MTDPETIWRPTPRQEVFLAAEEEEVLYGGAAGGGKTDALIVDALGLWQDAPLVPRYKALILRRTYKELREIVDRTRLLYPRILGLEGAKYREDKHEWRFPSGAQILMGYAERDQDVHQYQGEEFQWIGLEELTLWSSSYILDYLRSRLRGTHLKKLIRCNCNPGGPGSRWVQERWGIPDDGRETCSMIEHDVDGQKVQIRRRFIPAKVTDNPHLDVEYRANLLAMPDMQRRALLEGRWDVHEVPGAIYKEQLDAARTAGRITKVPYDPSVPVYVAWDLGIGDAMVVWCCQVVGREWHLIDYHEASGEGIPYFCAWLDGRGYRYAEDLFPHDGRARELGTGKSREEVARANGRKVRIVPQIGVEDGIQAVRLGMARMWFDEERCKRGIECLAYYRREWNSKMGEFKATPLHDWSSHGADAMRYLVVGLREKSGGSPQAKANKVAGLFGTAGGAGWMGA